MAHQKPNGNGGLTERSFTGARACQTPTYHFEASRPASGPSGQPIAQTQSDAGPITGKVNRLDWQTVVLWVFVAVSFAVFLFAGYLIWAKCRGSSNF